MRILVGSVDSPSVALTTMDASKADKAQFAESRRYQFLLPCGEQKQSVFPAKNCVDGVPESFVASQRAKLR